MKKDNNRAPEKNEKMKLRFNSRLLYSMITAVTLVALLFASYVGYSALDTLSSDHMLKIDMTKEKIFTPNPQTKRFASSIVQEIKITVMDSEANFSIALPHQAEVIKNYQSLKSDKITVDFVDPRVDPSYIIKYNYYGIELGDVVVTCGDRYKIVKSSDLFSDEVNQSTGVTIEYSKAEDAMNGAILFVTAEARYKAAFISGHGESVGEEFPNFLNDNIFETESVNLKSNPDLSQVDILICYGPTVDFTDEELKAIDEYLYNGGAYTKNLVMFTALVKSPTPNLDGFLKEWGITVTDNIVYENKVSNYYMNNKFALYAAVPSTETFYGPSLASKTPVDDYLLLVPYSRQILLNSPSNSYGAVSSRSILECDAITSIVPVQTVIEDTGYSGSDDDPTGKYCVGALSRKSNEALESRVLVFGSMDMISDASLNTRDLVNSRYIMDIFKSWVDRPINDIYIEPRNISGEVFTPSDAVAIILLFALVAVPLITVATTGVVIFVKRRHR